MLATYVIVMPMNFGMRVLLVDDDVDICASVRLQLEEARFVVDVAHDGKEGSFKARTADYDLVILDYMIPGMHGNAVCAEIRAAGKKMPILMLSVQADVQTKVDLLNLGADDYLAKPFSGDELLARVRALLRRPKELTPDMLMLGDITLDTRAHTVVRDGEELHLTRKEFMLLEYLMRNANHVVTRALILEHVWDGNIDAFTNTIETHVLSLRKKLEARGGSRVIHTVSGCGYKFAAR